ncbi:hypothetical protein JCM5350_003621 [Sporobolomyces pararoseus]
MSRSATPRLPFDATTASASLKSAFQAELEAVHRSNGPNKPEVYKPPQSGGGAWGGGGGWAQPKTNGLMADGKDFASTLTASLAKAKAAPSSDSKK